MSDVETVTPVETRPSDRFSHYARKADIVKSTVTGRPIVALCGKVWVPDRNPDRFPVCPRCKEMFAKKRSEERGG